METRIERIKKQLHSASYKLTPQREATVRVLLENEEDHLSAEDVYLNDPLHFLTKLERLLHAGELI